MRCRLHCNYSPIVAALAVGVASFGVGPSRADYLLYAVSDGCTADKVNPGDTVEVELWLSSDNEDHSNSIIVQIAFSSPGWVYNSLTWHGVYAGSIYDDSTPDAFPVMLTPDVLTGPSHPAGVVDIELSNVAIDPYCVGPNNAGAGPCDCPGGTCIGGQCVGGPFAGSSCSMNCPSGVVCTNRFAEGLLATLSLTVPPDFTGSDVVIVQPVVDTIANGFDEVSTSAWPGLAVYLECVVAGDIDCDGAVTLNDYNEWESCLTGPGGIVSPGCVPFDFDGDSDVDMLDWSGFQRDFTLLCGL
ncbi:MAG: hypothetical protein V3W34_16610 [Phycisphaerae bacterium]